MQEGRNEDPGRIAKNDPTAAAATVKAGSAEIAANATAAVPNAVSAAAKVRRATIAVIAGTIEAIMIIEATASNVRRAPTIVVIAMIAAIGTIRSTAMTAAIATIVVIVMIAAIGTTKEIATIVRVLMSATNRVSRDPSMPRVNASKENQVRPAAGVIGLGEESRGHRNRLTSIVRS